MSAQFIEALKYTKHQHLLILAGVCVTCFFHYLFFHGGYLGYDEMEYARLASLLAEGKFEHDSLYAYRYLAFLPLAFFYWLFGAGDFANWLVPTLTFLTLVTLVLHVIRKLPVRTKILTALFLTCSPIHLLYLEKPMPDLTTELGVFMCILSYYQQRFYSPDPKSLKYAFLFVAGALLVFLSKESFLVVYPFFLVLFGWDVWLKERIRYWMVIAVALIIFVLIYLTLHAWWLGNPLARLDAIFSNRYISECTYELQPTLVVLKRVAYELWLNLIRMGMLIPFGMAMVLYLRRRQPGQEDNTFWVTSWFAFLFLSNFMSISYSSYVPLCPDPRHFLFSLPLAAVVFARGYTLLSSFLRTEIIILIVTWGVQWLVSWQQGFENHHFLFLPLIVGFLWSWKSAGNPGWLAMIYLSFVSIFLQNASYNLTINHRGQKELITSVLERSNKVKLILTDGANVNIGKFYAGYSPSNQFIAFHEYRPELHVDGEVYIILNGMTAYLSNTKWELVPEFVKTANEKLPLVFENKSGQVYLYK